MVAAAQKGQWAPPSEGMARGLYGFKYFIKHIIGYNRLQSAASGRSADLMKITVIENTQASLRFKLSDASISSANAIRRAGIAGVASFAIDNVTFYENTTSMFDEYIAHRIGLVPLATPAKGYGDKDEILFTLAAEGPGTVYSKDLKSSDKSVKVANEKIPLMKLGEGQSLRLDGKAVLGTGARSSKFQPGLVTYKALSDTEFEFYIETFGQMPPSDILSRALGIISDGVKETYKELKK